MNYIVLDLEWNQSTAGKNKELKSLPFEIIEIGAVKLNEQFQILDRFQGIIRPVIYPQLNYISQEVTKLTAQELKHGETFPCVFKEFLSWCGEEPYRFCTWGPLDITELQRNMKHYQFPLFQTPVLFYDIQEIFSLQHEDGVIRRSLEYAVNFFQIENDHGFHRALSDAYYTVLVMTHLNADELKKSYTIDTFQKPKTIQDEIYLTYDNYAKYVSRTFSNKTLALKDLEVCSTRCLKCGKKLRKKIQWFSENNKNYYCLAFCPEHGYQTGKLRLKKVEGDSCFALKELRLADKHEVRAVFDKRNEYQRKRHLRRHQNKGV